MASQKEIEKYIDELKGPSKFSHYILWATAAFIVTFFMWAYFAKVDEVTHANGKIIPSRKVQLVQNLEGGIVSDIMVHEGEMVQKDQVIMQLSKVQFGTEFKENQARLLPLQAKYDMYSALVSDKEFVPSQELLNKIPNVIETEVALYKSKQNEMLQMKANKDLVNQEVTMTEPLIKSGSVSKVELLRLQQTLSDIQQKIHNAQSANLDELNKTKASLDSLSQSGARYQDKLERTTIRSPVKGIVKKLFVNTVGGVIKSGADLMEIVPFDDTLLVQAMVKPKDIGFIHPGQKAKVKISAFDFSIYGGFDGKIEHISADTIVDETNARRESFYEVWVRTDRNYLEKNGKHLTIIPGMTATVDVMTGEKTIFHYIMKPILKAKNNALRER